MRPKKFSSALLGYVVAAAIFALLLLLPFALQRLTGISLDTTFLIILAMVGCAWYLGRGPGLLVALLFEIALITFSAPVSPAKAIIVTVNRLLLFAGVVFFASARKKAERDLRDQSELLRVTLSSIGDGVIATDIDGRISFINPTAEALTGWKLDHVRGEHLDAVFKIVNEETREPVATPLAAIRRDGMVVGLANHTLLVTKDGRERPIDDSGAPIKDSDGRVIGAVIVFHDVSEKRKADREREALLRSERSARLEAERANRTKDEFLATVSHELRTPLNAILGWSAMLKKTPGNREAVSNGLAIIEKNARSQNEIISDILDVSRIVSGKLDIDLRPTHLSDVISSAVDSLRPAAQNKAVGLETVLKNGSALVSADPERLQQVFWNLISNSIKFTPAGGSISVTCVEKNGEAIASISDTGVGISSEFLPHVFDRFHQVDTSMKRSHGGLGLGLAIVRHFVELHDGSVSVTSEGEGLGTTFVVRIPTIAAIAPATESSFGAENDLSALSGAKILVVDDNLDSAEICCLALEEYGAQTRSVETVKDALKVFDDWKPDVLVSDLGMPGEDGFDLIARIRSLPEEDGGSIPAAALTAYARESDRQRVLSSGFDVHIPKPIDGDKLAHTVAELVSRSAVNTTISAA